MQHLQQVGKVRPEHVLGFLPRDGRAGVGYDPQELVLCEVLQGVCQEQLAAPLLDWMPEVLDRVDFRCAWRLEVYYEVFFEVRAGSE